MFVDVGNPFPCEPSWTRFPAVVVAPAPSETRDILRGAARRTRAYSSIGQSPRLITGLFLVRTQVGPREPWRATVPCNDKETAVEHD